MDARPISRVAAVLSRHGKRARGKAAPGGGGAQRGIFEVGAELTVFPDRILLDEEDADAVIEAHGRLDREQVKHPERLVVVPGGATNPKRRERVARFAARHELAPSFEPCQAGRAAVVAVDGGLVRSDAIVIGLCPEIGALGGLGAIVLRTQVLAVSDVLLGRPVETVVPSTRVVELTGRKRQWITSFDMAVAAVEQAGGVAALQGGMVELRGAAVAAMDVPDRLALCGALAAAGVAAVVPPDERTQVWLRTRGAERAAEIDQGGGEEGDSGAQDAAVAAADWAVDVSAIRSSAVPGSVWQPEKVLRAGAAARLPIAEAVLGGRIEELRAAAELLRERRVAPGVRFCVIPGSPRVLLHAIEEGVAAGLVRAGAVLLPAGAPVPPPLSSRPRLVNLQVGAAPDDVLASGVVVAASAASGRLADPEAVWVSPRRGSRTV